MAKFCLLGLALNLMFFLPSISFSRVPLNGWPFPNPFEWGFYESVLETFFRRSSLDLDLYRLHLESVVLWLILGFSSRLTAFWRWLSVMALSGLLFFEAYDHLLMFLKGRAPNLLEDVAFISPAFDYLESLGLAAWIPFCLLAALMATTLYAFNYLIRNLAPVGGQARLRLKTAFAKAMMALAVLYLGIVV